MLHYLGTLICTKDYDLGNNKTIVNSSTIPYAKLRKCRNALFFHHVREVIALMPTSVAQAQATSLLPRRHGMTLL
jgi:hypothetical protein